MADTIFEEATGLPLLPADEANERIVTLTAMLREFVDWGEPTYENDRGEMDCIYRRYVNGKHVHNCLWLRAKELINVK